MNIPSTHPSAAKIKVLNEDINKLKEELKYPHLTKDAEQDYDIKSRIIDKQAAIIELLNEHLG
ncbi:MAG TPA: hypothetical protein VK808_05790 [Bacteroidia bacterium]|jgi:hypothetical protein|nr:hypothetical protein [Bacteroidia bacterium]